MKGPHNPFSKWLSYQIINFLYKSKVFDFITKTRYMFCTCPTKHVGNLRKIYHKDTPRCSPVESLVHIPYKNKHLCKITTCCPFFFKTIHQSACYLSSLPLPWYIMSYFYINTVSSMNVRTPPSSLTYWIITRKRRKTTDYSMIDDVTNIMLVKACLYKNARLLHAWFISLVVVYFATQIKYKTVVGK